MHFSTSRKVRLRRSSLAPAHPPGTPAPGVANPRRLAASRRHSASLHDFAPGHARALARPTRTVPGVFAMLASRAVAAPFRLRRIVRSRARSSPARQLASRNSVQPSWSDVKRCHGKTRHCDVSRRLVRRGHPPRPKASSMRGYPPRPKAAVAEGELNAGCGECRE